MDGNEFNQEESTSEVLANAGRKVGGTAVDAFNLARGIKNNSKKNDDKKDENKKEGNESTLPKKDGLESKEGLGKKSGLFDKGKDLAGKGAKAAGEGIKKLWHLIPKPYNFIVLGGIALLFFLFLVLFLVLGGNDGETCYRTGQEWDLSDVDVKQAPSYENGLEYWASSSEQYQFFSTVPTYTDENGLLRVKETDDYVVAMSTYFGITKGTRYLVTMETDDGEIREIKVTLGDSKACGPEAGSNSDPLCDDSGRWHWFSSAHNLASILEFITGCSNDGVVKGATAHTGDIPTCDSIGYHNYELNGILANMFPGKVKKIAILESEEECSSGYTGNESIVEIAQAELDEWNRSSNTMQMIYKYIGANQYEPWCADFASYVLTQYGYEGRSRVAAPVYFDDAFSGILEYHPNDGGYTAQPGDLIFFNWSCGGDPYYNGSHVGIVKENDGSGCITTIEGNTGGGDGHLMERYRCGCSIKAFMAVKEK